MRGPAKKKRQCKECKGKGTVKEWRQDKNGKWIEYESQCDNCGGTGEEEATR